MMKNYLLLFVFVVAFSRAQDSSYCYNSGITTKQETVSETETPAFIKQQNSLILMPVMNEKEVLLLLKEKNNPSINTILKKRKTARALRYIGFLSIPLCVEGMGLIFSSAFSLPRTKEQYQFEGAGRKALGLAPLSVISSSYFHNKSKQLYIKALQKYNELYN